MQYCPFAVKLDRGVGSFNTLITYLIKYMFQIKKEGLNMHVFNMITGIN